MKSPATLEIQRAMRDIFETYSTLRDKGNAAKTTFWDIVVLTTCDAAQRSCFEEQVARKRASCELPQVPFHVVADPPGQKLGVGGSTLHVLSQLTQELGAELYNKKVLIIHSGGSSQRLPSYSVLGKIFAPMPVKGLCKGHGVPQMLDLKLAMYLPLCRLLGPGILVTCADDIETYCLDLAGLDTESLGRADVVALGHPSPLGVGRGHGVYVLQGGGVGVCGGGSVVECVEVLQKPSLEAMRSSGAVFCREGGGSKEEEEEEEHVWSDSVFWLSSGVCRRLLKWYVENRPLSGELDAYAHILPCLGARMETAIPDDYTDYRSQMLPLLRGASFKVIALPQSKFYHMGTMGEYVANFNTAEDFISELGIDRNTSNVRGRVEFVLQGSEEEEEEGDSTVHATIATKDCISEFSIDRNRSNIGGKSECVLEGKEVEKEEEKRIKQPKKEVKEGKKEGSKEEKEEENSIKQPRKEEKEGKREGREEKKEEGNSIKHPKKEEKVGKKEGKEKNEEENSSKQPKKEGKREASKEEKEEGEGSEHPKKFKKEDETTIHTPITKDFNSKPSKDRSTSTIRGKFECVLEGSKEEKEEEKRRKQPKKEEKEANTTIHTPMTQGTIIESLLTPDIIIHLRNTTTRYVIEHSEIGVGLNLTGDTILSNCAITSCPMAPLGPGTVITIPCGTLFHTVPIKIQSRSFYVTVAFDINGNMKAETTDLNDIVAFGRTLKDVMEVLGLTEMEMKKLGKLSLWTACIFSAAKTAAESFWVTYALVCRVMGQGEGVIGWGEGVIGVRGGLDKVLEVCKSEVRGLGVRGEVGGEDKRLFCMKDVVLMKDLNVLLEDRRRLVTSLGSEVW